MRLIDMSLGITLMITTAIASAAEGMVAVKSPHGPQETMDRLEAAVKAKGLNVFARIDHNATECDQVVQSMTTALENFAREATSR